MATFSQELCVPRTVDDHFGSRTRVARGVSEKLIEKINERVARAAAERMRFTRRRDCPCIVSVSRVEKGTVRVHQVLLGMHRSVVFYDDDLRRTGVFEPRNLDGTPSGAAFHLARDAPVYEKLPGIVAVACNCSDFTRRCTSTVGQPSPGAPGPSVNDARAGGGVAVMGAILGCKHMLAVEYAIEHDRVQIG